MLTVIGQSYRAYFPMPALSEEERKGRRRKKKGNTPQFDLRQELFRMSGTDLTRIDSLDVMTATTILSEVGWDMSTGHRFAVVV